MSIGETKVKEFINVLESLSQKASEDIYYESPQGQNSNEKEYLSSLINQARELIEHNEWYVALENTLDNLHEINYKLEGKVLDLASAAFESVPTKSDRANLIDLLRK